jgi:hypothetical protein
MIWDLISLIVLLAIGAGFVQTLLSMTGPRRRQRTVDDLRDRGPRSFAESGGRPMAARRPTAPAEVPAERRPRRPERMRPQRLIHTADEPTAEERPRLAPRQATRPVPRSGARAGQVRRQLADPRSVRAAFVLREVLERPLGLRDQG